MNEIQPTYEKIAPEGKTQINFANLLPCEIGLQYDDLNMTISSFSTENLYELNQKTNFIVNVSETCGSYSIDEEDRIVTHLIEGTSTEVTSQESCSFKSCHFDSTTVA